MVTPILNKSDVTITKEVIPGKDSPLRNEAFREAHLVKKRSKTFSVKGQVRTRQIAGEDVTRVGNDPQYDFYVIFNTEDLIAAGLLKNSDPNDDVRPGDRISVVGDFPGSMKLTNANITEVRPQSPDFFTGENRFLLIYIFAESETEEKGTLRG